MDSRPDLVSSTPLYTWRDIDFILSKENNPPWEGYNLTTEHLEIFIHVNDTNQAKDKLEQLFGKRYDRGLGKIHLESQNNSFRSLSVTIDNELTLFPKGTHIQRPLWTEDASIKGFTEDPPKGGPSIAAFYSFKGGVGRTTTLLATLNAILDKSKGESPNVLVVDADIEAPGLSLDLASMDHRFSMLDLLSLVHDCDNWEKHAIPIATERLKEGEQHLELSSGRKSFFFLPAFRSEYQLFNPRISIDQVIRSRNRAWIIPDILHKLGKALKVQAVLIDLRAGITEIASPWLFDRRIQPIYVTSASGQSTYGTRLVINRLSEIVSDRQNLQKPQIVLTMTSPWMSDSLLPSIIESLEDATGKIGFQDEEIVDDIADPNIHIAPFAQELQHYFSIESLLTEALPGTDLGKSVGTALANAILSTIDQDTDVISSNENTVLFAEIAETAKKLEFAEGNSEVGLLPTPALENLAQPRPGTLPVAAILGPKGAGKTFAWGQLVLARSWKSFVTAVGKNADSSLDALVFPLLHPVSMQDELRDVVLQAEKEVHRRLGVQGQMSANELREELSGRLDDGVDPFVFWEKAIIRRLGLGGEASSLESIASSLAATGTNIILAIDGLEDAFQPGVNAPLSPAQAHILRSLLQRLLNEVRDLGARNLGIAIFLRQDLAESAINQNFAQYKAYYSKYLLYWSPTEALRLVAWTLNRSGLNIMDTNKIITASYSELRTALEVFWGKRLGSARSKEAYCDRWVVAALSDFQGRVQARDVVRLLRFASEIMGDAVAGKMVPGALRAALPKCSELKVRELEEEVPELQPIFDKFRRAESGKKAVPFSSDDFEISTDEYIFLSSHGVLITSTTGELYIPEIIRHGLGFQLRSGRRAKVLALYSSALLKARRQ